MDTQRMCSPVQVIMREKGKETKGDAMVRYIQPLPSLYYLQYIHTFWKKEDDIVKMDK